MIEPRLHTRDRQCWCEPRIEEYRRFLVIHEDPSWIGQWAVFEFEEDGDVVVAPCPWDKDLD